MATDIATLAIKVDARDTEKASKSLKSMTKTGEKTEKRFSSMTATLKKSAMAAAAFAAVAGGVLATGIGRAVALASDLEETQNKFNVVFRGMTNDAEEWSKTLVKSYQMSNEESKRYLSGLQDLIVPTGMARKEAGKMSSEFVKLAADFGSFNNIPTASVVRDIQSAIAGGSETMLKYGVDVKVAAVKAEAFRLGLVKAGTEMSKTARMQALLSIMQRDGADAMGDSIRSSGSYALQMKEMRAKINDVATTIGTKFLPKVTEIITKVNDWIDNNQVLINQQIDIWANNLAEALSMLGKAIKFIIEHKEIVAIFIGMTVVLPKVAIAAQGAGMAVKGLGVVATALKISMPALTVAIAAFVGAFKLGEWFAMRDAMKGMKEAQEQVTFANKAAVPTLKEISDRTGVLVTTLDEFTQAEKDGKIVYDENLKLWIKKKEATDQLTDSITKLGDAYKYAGQMSSTLSTPSTQPDSGGDDNTDEEITSDTTNIPGVNQTNYFNTQLNTNDIVNITTEQARQGARA